jgi:hypothetical protein
MIAVQDAHPITRQAGRQAGLELFNDRNEPLANVMNHGRSYAGLGVIEFVVQGAEADADLGRIGLISGVVRAMDATDDKGGNIDESREQEFITPA